MNNNRSTAIWNRLLTPDRADLSADAARYFLHLEFPQADHNRMAELSGLAQAGKLSAQDQEELNEYLRIADLLAILQIKARKSLQIIRGLRAPARQ